MQLTMFLKWKYRERVWHVWGAKTCGFSKKYYYQCHFYTHIVITIGKLKWICRFNSSVGMRYCMYMSKLKFHIHLIQTCRRLGFIPLLNEFVSWQLTYKASNLKKTFSKDNKNDKTILKLFLKMAEHKNHEKNKHG